MKKKLTNLEKFGLIAAFVIVGSYFYLNKVYDPQLKRLKKTTKELNKVVSKINSLKTVESAFIYEKKIEKAKDDLAKLNKELSGLTLKDSSNLSTLAELEKKVIKKAELCGIVIDSISPEGEVEDIFKWHKYRLSVQCSFNQYLLFLSSIKKFKDPVKIKNLKIHRSENKSILLINMEVLI